MTATAHATAWVILALALLFGLLGAYPVTLFLAIAAGALAVLAPSEDARDARRRSAEPRYWHARPRRAR